MANEKEIKTKKSSKKMGIVIGVIFIIVTLVFLMWTRGAFKSDKIHKFTAEEKREAVEKRMEELKKEVKKEQGKTVGMTDRTRKQIFWDLIELQDSFMKKYPYDNQKQQEAYKIIAKKYGVLESVVRQIAVRGIKEDWPQPPLK